MTKMWSARAAPPPPFPVPRPLAVPSEAKAETRRAAGQAVRVPCFTPPCPLRSPRLARLHLEDRAHGLRGQERQAAVFLPVHGGQQGTRAAARPRRVQSRPLLAESSGDRRLGQISTGALRGDFPGGLPWPGSVPG